jgi:Porin subfamily
MKLSNVLLSSVAIFAASTAFAADLPAKKAAPAAKAPAAAVGCPAFGAGFFQIPGSETCIQFSGKMYADTTLASSSTDFGGTYSLYFDVRSNAEGGVVRGYAGTDAGTVVDKAYIQYAGLSAGTQTNLTKISGLGLNYGGTGYTNPTQSVYYSFPAGSSTISIGASDAAYHSTTNATQSYTTTDPDIAAQFKTVAGPATVTVAGATHKATDQSTKSTAMGYVGMANLAIDAGNGVNVVVYGAAANGATSYIVSSPNSSIYQERASDNNLNATAAGAQVTFTTGNVKVGAHYAQGAITGASSTYTASQYSAFAVFTVAKGLHIDPEYLSSTKDAGGSKTTSNTLYIRIARDF